jgi:predicted Fe-Mo cluster-binding NifX family protein
MPTGRHDCSLTAYSACPSWPISRNILRGKQLANLPGRAPAGTPLETTPIVRIAIPYWKGRVSPVFDAAGNLLLVDVEDGQELGRQEMPLTASGLVQRARQVSQLGADVLICGAVSLPLDMALSSAGVQVVSCTCGNVEDVLAAFLDGQLNEHAFLMPGCRGWRRRFRARRHGGRRSPDV